jgi:hypothetical protein
LKGFKPHLKLYNERYLWWSEISWEIAIEPFNKSNTPKMAVSFGPNTHNKDEKMSSDLLS